MKQAVKQAVKKPPKKDHPFWGLRAKLMLFMCLFSAFVLGLVWFFLQFRYGSILLWIIIKKYLMLALLPVLRY